MNCEYCDYYCKKQKTAGNTHENVSVCGFTDFVFIGDVTQLDIEYPCKNVSYESYLARIAKNRSTHNEIDWKIIYSKKRAIEEKVS
jgi:hypothetical protein